MSDELPGNKADWTERIDRLLAGSTVEQVRELVSEMRNGLDKISSRFAEHSDLVVGAREGMDAAVGSMRAEVDALSAQVRGLAERVGEVQSLREDLARALQSLAEGARDPDRVAEAVSQRSVEALSGRIVGFERDVRSVLEQMPRLEQQLTALAARVPSIDDVRASIDTNDVEEQISSASERLLGAFAQRVGQIQTLLLKSKEEAEARAGLFTDALTQLRDDIAPKIESIGEQVASGSGSAAVVDVVREIERRIASIETAVEVMPNANELTTAVGAELRSMISELRDASDAKTGSVAEQLTALSGRIGDVMDALLPLDGLRTEIETVVDRTSAFADSKAILDSIRERVDSLSGRIAADLEGIGVSLRTDLDSAFRARDESDGQRVDGLALRMTNLTMSVNQAVDTLRAQLNQLSERSTGWEAEQVAILEATRAEVARLTETVGRSVSDRVRTLAAEIDERVMTLTSALEQRSTALVSEVGERTEVVLNEVGERSAALLSGIDERSARFVSDISVRIESLEASLRAAAALEEQIRDLPRAEMISSLDGRLAALPSTADVTTAITEALRAGLTKEDFIAALEERLRGIPRTWEIASTLDERLDEKLAAMPKVEEFAALIDERLRSLPDTQALTAALGEQIEALPRAGEIADLVDERLGSFPAATDIADAVKDRLGVIPGPTDIADAVQERLGPLPRAEDITGRVGEQIAVALDEQARKLAADVTAVAEQLGHRVDATSNGIAERVSAVEGLLGALPAIDERTRALAPLQDIATTLPRIEEQLQTLGVLEQYGQTLRALEERSASFPTTDAIGDAIRSHLAGLGPDLREQITAATDALRARVEETIGSMREAIDSSSAAVQAEASSVREQLAPLADIAQIRAALERLEEDLRRNAGSNEETRAAVDAATSALRTGVEGAVSTVRASVDEAMSGVRAGMEQTIGGLREDVASAVTQISFRLDTVEAAVARTILDVRAGIADVSTGTSASVDQLRAAIESLAERSASIEALHNELQTLGSTVTESIGERTTAGLVALDDRLGGFEARLREVRARIGSLPAAEDIAAVVATALGDRTDTLGRDLGSVAANVNEIWMRSRALATAVDEMRGSLQAELAEALERIDRTGKRLDDAAAADERLHARLAELEQRIISAAREIENERDQQFVEVINDLIDRLPKSERVGFGMRLRSIVRRRDRDVDAGSQQDERPAEASARASTNGVSASPNDAIDLPNTGADTAPITIETPRTPPALVPVATKQKKNPSRKKAVARTSTKASSAVATKPKRAKTTTTATKKTAPTKKTTEAKPRARARASVAKETPPAAPEADA